MNNSRIRRHIRVKSKARFFIFVLFIMFGLTLLINQFNQFLGLNDANAAAVETEYITASVGYGDTLWDIANRYKSDGVDTRHAVYIIKSANDLKSSNLTEGMELQIPVTTME